MNYVLFFLIIFIAKPPPVKPDNFNIEIPKERSPRKRIQPVGQTGDLNNILHGTDPIPECHSRGSPTRNSSQMAKTLSANNEVKTQSPTRASRDHGNILAWE